MGSRGPQRRPNLEVVREGNPGHRKKAEIERGLKVPPAIPTEPEWSEWFPAGPAVRAPRRRKGEPDEKWEARQLLADMAKRDRADNLAAQAEAAAEWKDVVAVLDPHGVLSILDRVVVREFCICVVRIHQCERDISENGMKVLGERGYQKNPSVTAVNQYREKLRFYIAQLGLSPAARDGIGKPGEVDDDGDSPWDV